MESQEPAIEEKLVPFVEGALAEADRREVLQALPNYPALNHEVKQLRETILLLRTQAAQGLTYHSSVETPADQVVDYVLQGDQWNRQASRQFQLQMLESGFLADEVALLRELEQDLQQQVAAAQPVPPMSQALRASFLEAYGKPQEDPAWKRSMAVMLAWMSGLNLKVASAAVAGTAILVGGVSLGRYAHQQIQSSSSTKTVAVASPTASPGGATPAPVADAPKGQVALLEEKVHPEDLPRLSRLLWQKQVSHSYRDGQIFVAQGDVERAWGALSMNEKVAAATALKTAPVPEDKKTNLLDGIIGALPENKPATAPAKASPPTAAPAKAAAKATAPPEPDPAPAAGPAPLPRAAEVAIHLPAEPEATRVENYSYYREAQPRDAVPAATRAAEPAPVRQATEAVSRPAPPVVEEKLRPTQMARLPEPEAPSAGASRASGSAEGGQRSRPQVRQSDGPKEAVAPPVQALAPKAAPPGGGRVERAPVGQVASSQGRRVESAVNLKVEADSPDPVPSNVVVSDALEAGGEDRAKKDKGVTKPAPSVTAINQVPAGMRPVPKLPASGAADESDGAFKVKAGDPFEVAMLPIAKKLVEDMVGEAKVQMERQEDGHLLVTIRPARSLTPQEVEKLRKLIRTKLELKDEDTVVIRQP